MACSSVRARRPPKNANCWRGARRYARLRIDLCPVRSRATCAVPGRRLDPVAVRRRRCAWPIRPAIRRVHGRRTTRGRVGRSAVHGLSAVHDPAAKRRMVGRRVRIRAVRTHRMQRASRGHQAPTASVPSMPRVGRSGLMPRKGNVPQARVEVSIPRTRREVPVHRGKVAVHARRIRVEARVPRSRIGDRGPAMLRAVRVRSRVESRVHQSRVRVLPRRDADRVNRIALANSLLQTRRVRPKGRRPSRTRCVSRMSSSTGQGQRLPRARRPSRRAMQPCAPMRTSPPRTDPTPTVDVHAAREAVSRDLAEHRPDRSRDGLRVGGGDEGEAGQRA